MSLRPGWIAGCLLLAASAAYAPPRSGRSFRLFAGSINDRCRSCSQRTSGVSPFYKYSPGALTTSSTFIRLAGCSTPTQSSKRRKRTTTANTIDLSIQPDEWVRAQIDVLVRAARAFYDRDDDQDAYERA